VLNPLLLAKGIHDEGLSRLCQSVQAGPVEAVSAAVLAAMVGTEEVRDDIALLLFRRLESPTPTQ
jgi:hypothetical protein